MWIAFQITEVPKVAISQKLDVMLESEIMLIKS